MGAAIRLCTSRCFWALVNSIIQITPVCFCRSLKGEHETCAACQVPTQSKLFADYFPHKETEISLFEAIYGIACNRTAAHGNSEVYSW